MIAGVISVSGAVIPAAARAHDDATSSSTVQVSEQQVIWKIDVGAQPTARAAGFPRRGTQFSAPFDERELAARSREVGKILSDGLQVYLNGRLTPAEIGPLLPRYEPFLASGAPTLVRVEQELRFSAPEPIESLRAVVQFFSTQTSQHRALVAVRWDGPAGSAVRQFVRVGPSEIALDRGLVHGSAWTLGWDFGRWGAHHIFIGYDHIAFLLALLLAVGRFTELLKIVTAFTVAHSLTLLLAAFDVIRLPTRLTESLIAASIIAVAAENLIRRGPARKRWLLTFAFGLVHGTGFASALQERLAMLQDSVTLPVLAFNLGVEAGQMVIVGLAFPILIWLRRAANPGNAARRAARITRWGSIPILLLGAWWFFERVMP